MTDRTKRKSQADRIREYINRTGYTGAGHRAWTKAEDDQLRATRGCRIAVILPLFPSRTVDAINARRQLLGLARHFRRFTVAEMKLLKQHVGSRSWPQLLHFFPGRSRDSLRQLARRLGMPSVNRRPIPVGWNHPLYDEIRMRAWEDGISLRALNRELDAHGYFTQARKARDKPRKSRPINFVYVQRALDFFDARLRKDDRLAG